jgi:Zn-dependent M28 family amino/carboxypeptidase
MKPTADAPGANDDGSGVAGMMELAKIMNKRSYPWLSFCAVTEKSRDCKSRHLAEMAKAKNGISLLMLNNDMIGNSLSSGTRLSNNTKVRVFIETIPHLETKKKNAKTVTSDNDSPSRQLRYMNCYRTIYLN